MLTRRSFLLVQLAGLAAALDTSTTLPAFAKKRNLVPISAGPHAVSRQDWPPAIVPDHIGMNDKGYCCFIDEFGRLAIVDLRKPSNPKTPPRVVAELNGLAKKVIDFKVVVNKAYVLAMHENETGEPQLAVITISIVPVIDPSIIDIQTLDKFSEATSLAASSDLYCVAGSSTAGENLIGIYSSPIRKSSGTQSIIALATMTTEFPVVQMDLQDKNLLVLESGNNASQLEYFSLVDARTPHSRATLKLDGEFKALARFKDTAVVAGIANANGPHSSECLAISVALEPQPRIVSQVSLSPMINVLDASTQKDRCMVFGEGGDDRILVSLLCDKRRGLKQEQVIMLARQKGGYGAHSNLVLGKSSAYVASGWAGVQMIDFVAKRWTEAYNYSIPRLPASSMASWGDLVVLAGADLKLYDIQQPAKPSLIGSSALTSSVKSVVGAGSFVICLTRDSMVLRKMDKLDEAVATVKILGQQLCYDKIQQRSYVLFQDLKKTTVTKFQVYSNTLISEKVYDVPGSFSRASANGGSILLGGLNDVSLYATKGDKADFIGSRHFENLAVRDVFLLDDVALITAVDQNSKGFFLVLSKDQKDMHVLGSIDLPHDGVALSAFKTTAVAVGRTPEGKDLVTIINLATTSAPKIVTSLPTIEAASAVVVKDQFALIAGRGLEIVTLS